MDPRTPSEVEVVLGVLAADLVAERHTSRSFQNQLRINQACCLPSQEVVQVEQINRL